MVFLLIYTEILIPIDYNKRFLSKKVWEYAKYAWNETFPNHESEFQNKVKKNKEKYAKVQAEKEKYDRDYTPEEYEQMDAAIPEWKKGSITVKEGQKQRETFSMRIRKKVMDKISNTELYQELQESEAFKEYKKESKDTEKSYDAFRDNVSESIDSSQSPVIKGVSNTYTKIKDLSTQTSSALAGMKDIDPLFDIQELEEDAQGIFELTFTTFLEQNMEDLQEMCCDGALAFFKVYLNYWETKECEPKFKFLWNIEKVYFKSTFL